MSTRLAPLTQDRLLATALTVLAQLEIWLRADLPYNSRLSNALIAPLLTASLAWRRRYPTMVGTAVPVLSAVQVALGRSPQILAAPLATLTALYALAVWTSRRRFGVGVVGVAAADLFSLLTPRAQVSGTLFFTASEVVLVLLVRRVVADRDRRSALAERERDVLTREAIVAERARIARELHDEIAHDVSMIVLQAGAERRVLADTADSTRGVLETIEQTGRRSLTEMRRLVGMLRSDEPDSLFPQPRLDDLPTLISQVGAAGLAVQLTITGDPRDLPVGIELSAYRIVQEALTNALKHAGDATVHVRVRYDRDCLQLEVVDDGRADRGADRPVGPGGHGLVGMRERVALYGGRFEAGPGDHGGYVVRAQLPTR